MELTASLEARCDPWALFGEVDDLARYPAWLSIVPRADQIAADDGDSGPAWSVELRGRLGRLARSKRLRMVRTLHDPPRRVRFERFEVDGKRHSPWVLEAEVAGFGETSRLEMRLHYGGPFPGPVVERLLRDEIDASRQRLLARLARA